MLLEECLIFFPGKRAVGASPGDEVRLETDDGVVIRGWYLSHPEATVTLLYLHGNAGNLEDRRALVLALRMCGMNVLAIDYRGYGGSTGQPSEAGLYTDALAAYAWLAQRVPATSIIAYGESLGGAVACELAASRPLGGLVLQSTFTSIADMAALSYPWLPLRWLVHTKFDNLGKLARVTAPKLFIHGRRDEVVPLSMAERLFEAATAPKHQLWLPNARHDDLYTVAADVIYDALRRFVRERELP
jgi:fermentation-respiration switch protein FrsA (DUF1100 family)